MIQNIDILYWQKYFLFIGALFLFFAVATGSFGAHYLKDKLNTYSLNVFETGVKYQFYQSLFLMMIAFTLTSYPSIFIKLAGLSTILGILLFSGSLYALALTNIKILGAITPIGGIFFLVGYLFFCIGLFK